MRMEIIINSKRFDDWTIEDLSDLLDNPEYPESQLLDYKKEFDFLRSGIDKNAKLKGKNSFKKDICSFANADGGVILIGLDEDSKTTIPKDMTGVEIKTTTEKFEMILFDSLNGIVPAIPQIRIRFWRILDQRYVVGIQIMKGALAPYSFAVDGAYYFKIRRERHNLNLSYREIKEMYVCGISLEEKIYDFRKNRIDYYILEAKDLNKSITPKVNHFAVFHIIPHDFYENANKIHRYLLQKNNQFNHKMKFRDFCYGASRPSYDGLSYNGDGFNNNMRIKFFNNGVIELFLDLDESKMIIKEKKRLVYTKIIDIIYDLLRCYVGNQHSFSYSNNAYICASLIGCKGIETETNFCTNYTGYIDDDFINCRLCEILDINEENCDNAFNLFKQDFLLSIGVKNID